MTNENIEFTDEELLNLYYEMYPERKPYESNISDERMMRHRAFIHELIKLDRNSSEYTIQATALLAKYQKLNRGDEA